MCRLMLCAAIITSAACAGEPGVGPDPSRPQHYMVEMLGSDVLPAALWGGWKLDSAFLIPVSVGRTIDQRLVNDRTGGGGTGGNTRDTTVARGQFIDLRIIGDLRDSAVVEVMFRDTVAVITRPHADPSRVRVDSGWFIDGKLILPTIIDYRQKLPFHIPGLERCPPMKDFWTNTPCEYRTELIYKLNRQ